MKTTLAILVGIAVAVVVAVLWRRGEVAAAEHVKARSEAGLPTSAEDRAPLELGRKVLAVEQALQDPRRPDAMKVVTDLGLDQRYYVMVRGWLSYQLQADMSILDANRERTPSQVKNRIEFVQKAIRAIDLE